MDGCLVQDKRKHVQSVEVWVQARGQNVLTSCCQHAIWDGDIKHRLPIEKAALWCVTTEQGGVAVPPAPAPRSMVPGAFPQLYALPQSWSTPLLARRAHSSRSVGCCWGSRAMAPLRRTGAQTDDVTSGGLGETCQHFPGEIGDPDSVSIATSILRERRHYEQASISCGRHSLL